MFGACERVKNLFDYRTYLLMEICSGLDNPSLRVREYDSESHEWDRDQVNKWFILTKTDQTCQNSHERNGDTHHLPFNGMKGTDFCSERRILRGVCRHHRRDLTS